MAAKSAFKFVNSSYESPLGENSSFNNPKQTSDKLQIVSIEGPFNLNDQLVKAVSRNLSYYYLISFSRQINATDANKVTTGASYDDNTQIYRFFSGGQIKGDKLKVYKVYFYIGDIPNISMFKEVFYRKSVALFIGGAGDSKEFYIYGISFGGPTYIMDIISDKFKPVAPGEDYISIYLGYEEIFKIDRITKNVLDKIPDKDLISVSIIGHSLGGWNGAHLSNILDSMGYKVSVLITLDPVGANYNTKLANLEIYFYEPEPVAELWINTATKSSDINLSDIVAWSGKQWLPTEGSVGPLINVLNPHHHDQAKEMFFIDIVRWNRSISNILVTYIQAFLTEGQPHFE